MKTRISTCKSPRWFAHYVSIMREYELYSGLGSGFDYLIRYNDDFDKIIAMSILKINNRPIGVAIKLKDYGMMGCNITCFVLENHRRKGYGTRLVNALIDREELSTLGNQFPSNFPKVR